MNYVGNTMIVAKKVSNKMLHSQTVYYTSLQECACKRQNNNNDNVHSSGICTVYAACMHIF